MTAAASPFDLQFTPTSGSRLNMIERWFRELTDKRIRQGTSKSLPGLIASIDEYISKHNQNPQVLVL